MHVHWRIQQVTTRVGAVTCWIQQPVSTKQVVGFSSVFNSEVDELKRKSLVLEEAASQHEQLIVVTGFTVKTGIEAVGVLSVVGRVRRLFRSTSGPKVRRVL